MTRPGDVDSFTRVRCYEVVMQRYPAQAATLALLPLAMRMAGPREALWHAIIRKNHGCTHMIVGRDHAGAGKSVDGLPFYAPYAAQELVAKHQAEIGIGMVPFREMRYVEDLDAYLPDDEVRSGTKSSSLSGTELRALMEEGRPAPAWFTYPEVAERISSTHPPRSRQGFTVFFTGLAGSGKSTISNALRMKLLEIGGRSISLLDGDIMRKHLSSELGFSKDHRDLNIRRIGFVAAEVTRAGGIAICAPIAPYDAARKDVRETVNAGGFLLVALTTPLQVCERRDRKGQYARARQGMLPNFTGVMDPYEKPTDAEIEIDTTDVTPTDAADRILGWLRERGFIPALATAASAVGAAALPPAAGGDSQSPPTNGNGAHSHPGKG